jgi:HSP20 family molecular chaperone IbpA
MGTFMEKLKGKGLVEKKDMHQPDHGGADHAHHEAPSHALQLPVDVYQSDSEIVIYSQLAGMDLNTLDVAIGGENDVITIEGRALRPEHLARESIIGREGEFSLEECQWGDFYRQIILPEPIEPEAADAKTKDGVLILRLPLKSHHAPGVRLNVVRLDDHHHE